MPIDLRSDTVTRPTAAMRRAMAEAEVGDDVYGEDPTVRRLQELAAELTGQESALFVPSGCMGNQIAIGLHAPRGSDVLVEEGHHVYLYELGATAAISGAQLRPLRTPDGRLRPAQLASALAPPAYDLAQAALLVLENTHNHAGGVVLDVAETRALVEHAHALGLRVHLDGARLFNAAVALGVPARDLAAPCDSVMFCLSKGLGAPVGSMLCGSRAFIEQARVGRKRLGGGMRQVGILAAAGLHALEHHVERLADDHRRARRLAEVLAARPGFGLDPDRVRTNIVIAELDPPGDVERVQDALAARGVLASSMGPGRIRFVTHLDVDDAALDVACSALADLDAALG